MVKYVYAVSAAMKPTKKLLINFSSHIRFKDAILAEQTDNVFN